MLFRDVFPAVFPPVEGRPGFALWPIGTAPPPRLATRCF